MERTVPWRDQDEDFLAAGRFDKSKAKDPGQPSKENKSEDSESCKMLEKHKYWIEFDPTRQQFFKVMYCDFRNQLVIPTKFTTMFQESLSDTVYLKGPSGHIWAVKLIKKRNEWIFQNGWENFVQDHGLDKADFLIFRYDGNSTFMVAIFDKTGCEREGCYFIKEHTSSCSRFCSAASKVDSNDDSSENVIVLDKSEKKDEQKRESDEMDEGNHDCEGTIKSTFGEKSYSYYLLSNRRQVTEQEKKRPYLLAAEHSSTRPSFKLVMKPTNVYHYFFLSIPKKWRGKHIPATNNLEIQLRVPPSKKTWSVLLKYSKYKTGFGKGWTKFVLDNNLEAYDVCIFELKKGEKRSKKIVIFDVIIFRVVDEVVPLTPSTRNHSINQ